MLPRQCHRGGPQSGQPGGYRPSVQTLARGIVTPDNGGYRATSRDQGPLRLKLEGEARRVRIEFASERETREMGKVGTLKWLVAATVAATALLTIVAVSGAAPGTDASVSAFDQCANGQPPSVDTGCSDGWINGILNTNNSHYAEDDVTPQR